MGYLFLSVAIFSEILATSFLKASEGFTQLVPTLISLIGYGTAFYFLSLSLKTIPIGIAYATWSGIGIVLLSIIAMIVYKQSIDLFAVIGFTLITVGVVILNVFSKSTVH